MIKNVIVVSARCALESSDLCCMCMYVCICVCVGVRVCVRMCVGVWVCGEREREKMYVYECAI